MMPYIAVIILLPERADRQVQKTDLLLFHNLPSNGGALFPEIYSLSVNVPKNFLFRLYSTLPPNLCW